MGWLITDGYGAYRHRKRRQRCLAHLIRKAIGIAESINSRTARIGTLILEDKLARKGLSPPLLPTVVAT